MRPDLPAGQARRTKKTNRYRGPSLRRRPFSEPDECLSRHGRISVARQKACLRPPGSRLLPPRYDDVTCSLPILQTGLQAPAPGLRLRLRAYRAWPHHLGSASSCRVCWDRDSGRVLFLSLVWGSRSRPLPFSLLLEPCSQALARPMCRTVFTKIVWPLPRPQISQARPVEPQERRHPFGRRFRQRAP